MIKFFRNIRKQYLSQNKIGKYLVYALGETVLVVIGILIALNLNKRNEHNKSLEKIDTIFEDLLTELEINIEQSTVYILEYQKKDSLAGLVLNDKVTYADYASENSRDLWRLVDGRFNYRTSKQAYDVLMSNVDQIPQKYDEVLKTLGFLYNYTKYLVDEFNVIVKDLVDRNITHFQDNYKWFSTPNRRNSNEAIDYVLNDYTYKNRVVRYRDEAMVTHRSYIEQYRLISIIAYKEIATVLGKPMDSVNFILNKKVLDTYTGHYTNELNPESTVQLSVEEDIWLVLKGHKKNPEGLPLMPLESEEVFTLLNVGITRFRTDENKNIYMTIYNADETTRYIKTKP